jgi:release factor glutamine methyltransferase
MLKNILISKLFDLDILDVVLGNYQLDQSQQKTLATKLELLESGFPLDYLIGKVKVLGLELIVNQHTLIPREETDYWLEKFRILISRKVECLVNSSPPEGWQSQTDGVFQGDATQNGDTVVADTKSHILVDLGTGTGIIGLYLSDVYNKVYLVDIDKQTLKIANQNIELNQKTNCYTLISNGLESLNSILEEYTKWDLVANLPYLPSRDVIDAKEFKVEYEPALALYSGDDGLELFNKVIRQIKAMRNKPDKVLFELDPRNIQQAQINLKKLNYQTEIWLDQNGLERVLLGRLLLLKFLVVT